MLPTTQSNITDLQQALKTAKIDDRQMGDNSTLYLKFDSNTGEWVYGQDAEDATGEQIIILTDSISHGWTLWHQGKPAKTSASFVQPLPEPPEPVYWNDAKGRQNVTEASESRSFICTFYPPEEGETLQLCYDTNSLGGRDAVNAVIAACKLRAQTEAVYLYPIVKLGESNYFHKTHGKTIYKPVLEIVGWADVNGEQEQKHIEPPKQEEQPRRRRRVVTS